MNARENAQGEWLCTGKHGCGRFLPLSAYGAYRDGGKPAVRCQACKRTYQNAWLARRGLDEDWWRAKLETARSCSSYQRRRKDIARQRAATRRERTEMARAMLTRIESWGVSWQDITQATGVRRLTLHNVRYGAARVARPGSQVLERLVLLAQVLEDVPRHSRPHRNTPGHPHLREITYRYQALREAHA